MFDLPIYLPDGLRLILIAVAAAIAGAVAGRLLMSLAKWLAKRNPQLSRHINLARLATPLYIVAPVLAVFIAVRAVAPEIMLTPFVSGTVKVASVALLYWLAMRIIDIVTVAVSRRYDITVADNLRARRIRTQIVVVKSIANFIVFLLALAAVFLMFDTLRGLGVSLLASAGVAGLAIGFAAQKTLGNLLAGIQIAFTQPIRLEDAVVVENEWGWVEEITLTYVIIRLWDLRRLVLPISYFIEKPFQNWTRTSASIIGTVELYADYTLPIDPLREKLVALLETTKLWDKQVQVVQVTDCDKDVIKIRILVSAANSPTAWDLRCFVREQMIRFIQDTYPQCLPKTRAALESPDDYRDQRSAGFTPQPVS
ncbi:mechanosensitive ion channel family protein [Asticcacaulis taihuensis]|uniref:mechanosensitive ion channel family protein n=1 Tax=Asticcacaulis taihuensis TaxID=260084 RepID=UPI003F7B503C